MIDPFRFPEPWEHLSEIEENLSDKTILFVLEKVKPENVEYFEKQLNNILEERKEKRLVKYAKNRKNGLYCYIALIITAFLCATVPEIAAFFPCFLLGY